MYNSEIADKNKKKSQVKRLAIKETTTAMCEQPS